MVPKRRSGQIVRPGQDHVLVLTVVGASYPDVFGVDADGVVGIPVVMENPRGWTPDPWSASYVYWVRLSR